MNDDTWVRACSTSDIETDDVIRFDQGERSFAIYNVDGAFYATEGYCTHEKQHLADGLVDDGIIECPLHMGQFDIKTGEAVAGPVCIHLATYKTKIANGDVFIQI